MHPTNDPLMRRYGTHLAAKANKPAANPSPKGVQAAAARALTAIPEHAPARTEQKPVLRLDKQGNSWLVDKDNHIRLVGFDEFYAAPMGNGQYAVFDRSGKARIKEIPAAEARNYILNIKKNPGYARDEEAFVASMTRAYEQFRANNAAAPPPAQEVVLHPDAPAATSQPSSPGSSERGSDSLSSGGSERSPSPAAASAGIPGPITLSPRLTLPASPDASPRSGVLIPVVAVRVRDPNWTMDGEGNSHLKGFDSLYIGTSGAVVNRFYVYDRNSPNEAPLGFESRERAEEFVEQSMQAARYAAQEPARQVPKPLHEDEVLYNRYKEEYESKMNKLPAPIRFLVEVWHWLMDMQPTQMIRFEKEGSNMVMRLTQKAKNELQARAEKAQAASQSGFASAVVVGDGAMESYYSNLRAKHAELPARPVVPAPPLPKPASPPSLTAEQLLARMSNAELERLRPGLAADVRSSPKPRHEEIRWVKEGSMYAKYKLAGYEDYHIDHRMMRPDASEWQNPNDAPYGIVGETYYCVCDYAGKIVKVCSTLEEAQSDLLKKSGKKATRVKTPKAVAKPVRAASSEPQWTSVGAIGPKIYSLVGYKDFHIDYRGRNEPGERRQGNYHYWVCKEGSDVALAAFPSLEAAQADLLAKKAAAEKRHQALRAPNASAPHVTTVSSPHASARGRLQLEKANASALAQRNGPLNATGLDSL